MIILLSTILQSNYFNQNVDAPYNISEENYNNYWQPLSQQCPLKGIGFYRDHPDGRCQSSNNFVYLRINGIRYDGHRIHFDFHFLGLSNTQSINFIHSLPYINRNPLFSKIDDIIFNTIRIDLNLLPSQDWNNIALIIQPPPPPPPPPPQNEINNFIGNYFLEIKTTILGNNEFEDRIFNLLTALGFETSQRGHIIRGAFPDGYAFFNNNILVYDCKNSINYFPHAEDRLAMDNYIQQSLNLFPEFNNYFPVFIAKSFSNNLPINYKCINIDSLLYLYYKKIRMGVEFHLNPLINILLHNQYITRNMINANWL